ncbi:hypothetical protein T01_12601 [Trichinella spiralis]|uniref:Uncharacterized protein n=1 Tax=Trichinella spiralis TaxID=6334 RepID=A0A0V1BDL0_TRISP|nr:hypothetical protein T01_11515 [Trichinella spiralis]KRY34911.1 hypothetical protein T01_12601 [Trichinella spiralis]
MNSGALVRLINVASTGLGKALKAHCSAMNSLRGPLYSLHVIINEAWLRYR